MIRIAVIGCGYVFDHYMTTIADHPAIEIAGVYDLDRERAERVGAFYGLPVYEGVNEPLTDPSISIVANLTSIESHLEVSRAAIEAGKHVYSEKPLATTMDEAHALVDLAAARGMRLSAAPSNALSATVQTLWKAVEDRAVGDVRVVYAEFDDNPVYLLEPETWVSRSGAPWPYLHEYEMGCTWEHVGYHLTWMCAIFGPVRHVTAFSKRILPDKTDARLDPADTPDFSVACLDFECGVVGRITCSIAAPTDHRMRIVGNEGVLTGDTYRDYRCPVRLEPFNTLSLKARNLRIVRESRLLRSLTGVGGVRVPLAESAPPGGTEIVRPRGGMLARWKASQRGWQDKSIGLAELAAAIREDRPHFPSPAFTLHLTELTLVIQGAGPDGASQPLSTHFEPLALPERTRLAAPDYRSYRKRPLAAGLRRR